jgi:pimeloyl-ACP methyl ester carboxylesterase
MVRYIKLPSFKLAVYMKGKLDSKKLAIVLPGRLDTKDYPHMKSHVDYLAKKGYLALSFDPPGTWESPGSLKLYTTTNYIEVVKEIIGYFGNRPTLLAGHSRGGSVAILVGTTHPSVTGIILLMANYGPPSSPKPAAKKLGYHVSYRDLPGKPTQRKRFELPIRYFIEGRKYDSAKTIRKCARPKLVIFGTKDEFTPPKDVLRQIPQPKMVVELDTVHDYRNYPE